MPISPPVMSTEARAPARFKLGRVGRSIARIGYWPALLGLVALNAWWWWDARPMPALKVVQAWIGVEKESGSRPVAWWDVWDVPRDNRGAISVLRRAVRHSPNDPEARFLLGRALGANKEYRACAEQMRLVPNWSPRKPDAQYIEGMAWLQLKRVRDAERAFVAYLKVDPNHPTPRKERVTVEKKLLDIFAYEDRWDEAQALIWRAYVNAEGLPSSQRELLEMSLRTRMERSHPGVALEFLREFVAADPDDWEARRALAHAADVQKEFAEADAAIARCLAERPTNARAWGDWLEMLWARNDFKTLSDALSRVPKEADADVRVWKIRGRVKRQAKDYPGVVEAFSQALEIDPFDLDAHFSLAFALQMTGKPKEAEEHRRRHAALEAMTREVPDAINHYKDVTDLPAPKPDDVRQAMRRLADACEAMGWPRDARGWRKAAADY